MNNITLPKTLIKRLEKISAGLRYTPESIVKQAVADRLDYEEWKSKRIQEGLADVKAGRVHSKEEFWVQLEKARNERKKAA